MALTAHTMSFEARWFLCTFLLAQVGCQKTQAPASSSTQTSFLAANEQVREDVLLQIVSLSHRELSARLGPHRVETHSRYSITPIPSPRAAQVPPVAQGFRADSPAQPFAGEDAYETAPVSLSETRFVEIDAEGRLHLGTTTDHDGGIEAFADAQNLLSRMRHEPCFRFRNEGDRLENLRRVAFDSGAALLETVAHKLQLGMPQSGSLHHRDTWQVALSLSEQASVPRNANGSAWRGAVQVESLSGTATIDRDKHVPLALELNVRFVALRPGVPDEKVQVEATHKMGVVALGKEAIRIALPTDCAPSPVRPRPQLDRQDLLNGLLPSYR